MAHPVLKMLNKMIFKFRRNFNLLYKSYYANLIGIPSAEQNEFPGSSLCRILCKFPGNSAKGTRGGLNLSFMLCRTDRLEAAFFKKYMN